jgi:hypothetical protein
MNEERAAGEGGGGMDGFAVGMVCCEQGSLAVNAARPGSVSVREAWAVILRTFVENSFG